MERRILFINHNRFKEIVPDRIDTVIVPVGTIEAHGITPLGTDVIIPERMACDIAGEIDALVAPTVSYGVARSLCGHPGTLAIGSEVFEIYMSDIVTSLAKVGFGKIIVLNGHGGQIDELKSALFRVSREYNTRTLLINWWYELEDLRKSILKRQGGHAGSDETACIMAIDASLVEKDLLEEKMFMRHTQQFSAYPFPGSIITYSDGDSSLNLDENACKKFYQAVTKRLVELIRNVLQGWESI